MEPVLFYEGPHYMYSNFAAFAVSWNDRWAMTAEHHYQAAKFFGVSGEIVEAIYAAQSAHEAKQISKRNKERVRPDWEKKKLEIMADIVWAKLMQHEYIQRKLLATGDRGMVEDSPQDSFWGRGPDGNGRNELGRIWMRARDKLCALKKAPP
ncbi:MAG: NADAR family protein [Candidatus Moraniibacteriota bacterium]